MINTKYSFGDFLDQDLSGESASDFNNTTIKGSCFYQQYHIDSEIFPAGMTGVTFENCNLDNVKVPAGNTIIDSSNRKIRVQFDNEDWVLDNALNPVEPANLKLAIKDGKNIDPSLIPASRIIQKVITEEEFDSEFKGSGPIAMSWFKTTPNIIATEIRKEISEIKEDDFNSMKQQGKYGRFKASPVDVTSKHRNVASGNVMIEGSVEYRTIEGEVYLFKDSKDGSFH